MISDKEVLILIPLANIWPLFILNVLKINGLEFPGIALYLIADGTFNLRFGKFADFN